jgi:hypothetical protein
VVVLLLGWWWLLVVVVVFFFLATFQFERSVSTVHGVDTGGAERGGPPPKARSGKVYRYYCIMACGLTLSTLWLL